MHQKQKTNGVKSNVLNGYLHNGYLNNDYLYKDYLGNGKWYNTNIILQKTCFYMTLLL